MNRQQDGRSTFLTNHARVLLAIARDPSARLRTIAVCCQITERTAQAIVADLEQAGYLQRHRAGRRNRYTLYLDQPLRHPAESGLRVRALVELAATAPAELPGPDPGHTRSAPVLSRPVRLRRQ
ncbi:helix-turn-helix transcriptional regulator [Streptomyces aureocirculatus]|uniref:helix-turn-helix transcriptional regulator n=1 Tax=Streptomyces aureocirculatus TaxID=67275 RepID=UPI00099B8E5E|nr:helix-turn-helix domain-containing protein [Streptomyces aureocirculatus]